MSRADDWVAKAEADYRGAAALNRRRKEPLPDLVCYHCHQSVEKYLKAFLVSKGYTPPRIHDLIQLLSLCALFMPALAVLIPTVSGLNPYGILVRYPGVNTAPRDAKMALGLTRRARSVLRRELGL